jgi:hypothetical protein
VIWDFEDGGYYCERLSRNASSSSLAMYRPGG